MATASTGDEPVIEGVRVLPLRRFEDERGWFYELRRESTLPKPTRQTNVSFSRRGELEITDVNNWYVEQGTMEYDVLEGFWGDAGESIDAYYEVNDFVRTLARG